jgi:membrane-associated phospholipid phosphatase
VAATASRNAKARRGRAALCSIAVTVLAIAARWLSPDLRAWCGNLYLVAGYWIPAMLVTAPHEASRFERWLLRNDEQWRRFAVALPAWATSILELSYLLCYVSVPAAFVFVWATGTPADVDRFWTAVLLSGFLCYGTLPWLTSRPPRIVRGVPPAQGRLRALNQFVLAHMGHGLNTFPSGHVALSVAAALQVLPTSQPVGMALLLVAFGIGAGALAGRYHYSVDVVLGAAIGAAAALLI